MPNSPKKGAFPYSFGWLPDLPDSRDYTSKHPKVAPLLPKTPIKTPKTADLRPFCPPIFDQGNIGSCTANAAAALLSYHNKRTYGKETPLSRLFIYKGTRDLMQSKGDSGAFIRTTMGSLALFGAPPEKYWSYGEDIDRAPPAFCYSFAQNYQAINYFRLDEKTVGIPSTNSTVRGRNVANLASVGVAKLAKDKSEVLNEIKSTLAQSLPVMFGFQVFESIRDANDGKIPYPARGEAQIGGHAVLCVGYDDALKIGASTGAFLIRNSWGEGWGEKGYGWLPYDYLLAGLAQDWWALVKAEWMSVEEFGV